MARARQIMIVGNGAVDEGAAPLIDAADMVIRFNGSRNFGAAGTRTDVVAVCNTGSNGVGDAFGTEAVLERVGGDDDLHANSPVAMPLMLPVGLRIDACPLHKGGWRLLFISTKALGMNVVALSRAGSLRQENAFEMWERACSRRRR